MTTESASDLAVPTGAAAYPFDPAYGYDLNALRAVGLPPAPDDFDTFWRATWQANEDLPLALSIEDEPGERFPGWRVQVVRYTVLGGYRVGAWLVTPRDGDVTVGAVIGHGYGGRDAPDRPQRRAAHLFVCSPGFHLSAAPGLPDGCYEHVVHGIAHRETYLLRACVCAHWSGARVLAELGGGALRATMYIGGSFGGGIGALGLPWDARWSGAMLALPTFGHHPLRLTMPCQGSGEAVRQYYLRDPSVTETLAYYDAATAADRVQVPTVCAPARFDPAVPPPGQFAVSNALARRGGSTWMFTAGHIPAYPGDAEENRGLDALTNEVIWKPWETGD